MGKGFGATKTNKVDSLCCQLTGFINAEYTENGNVGIFVTHRKHRNSLSIAVNKIAQKFPLIHLQVVDSDTELQVLIATEIKDKKGLCCVWVEKSDFTSKWLVQASPPGSWDYRPVSVWDNRDKALEVANSIYKDIRSMSPFDWRDRTTKYREFLRNIPEDDDSIIAVTSLNGHYISPEVKNPDRLRDRLRESFDGIRST